MLTRAEVKAIPAIGHTGQDDEYARLNEQISSLIASHEEARALILRMKEFLGVSECPDDPRACRFVGAQDKLVEEAAKWEE